MSPAPLARSGSPARSVSIDVLVKSPGVSLYRERDPDCARESGVQITSLLNLWFAEEPEITTIAVTGTKGKSTTASLIAHILTRLGRQVALAGNIGVAITEIANADYAVIEVSSYQAADFDGVCDLGVLTSLYPEHTDWHLSCRALHSRQGQSAEPQQVPHRQPRREPTRSTR